MLVFVLNAIAYVHNLGLIILFICGKAVSRLTLVLLVSFLASSTTGS